MRDRPPGEGARGEGGRPGMFAGERGSAAEKREKLWDRGARRMLKLNLVAGPRGRGGMADLNLHPTQPRSNAFVAVPPCCRSTGAGAGRGADADGGGCPIPLGEEGGVDSIDSVDSIDTIDSIEGFDVADRVDAIDIFDSVFSIDNIDSIDSIGSGGGSVRDRIGE